jgi:hypothetical protein
VTLPVLLAITVPPEHHRFYLHVLGPTTTVHKCDEGHVQTNNAYALRPPPHPPPSGTCCMLMGVRTCPSCPWTSCWAAPVRSRHRTLDALSLRGLRASLMQVRCEKGHGGLGHLGGGRAHQGL